MANWPGQALRGLRAALAFGVLALAAPSAEAYSVSLAGNDTGALVRWPTNKLTFKLHPSCSADLPKAQCLEGLRSAFRVWTGQACTGLQFQEDTSAWTNNSLQLTAFGYENGKNELAWIEDNRWVYGEYVLAVTVPYFDTQSGAISEADIVFNGYLQTWQMDGADYSTDVVSVAVHEIGHFFGLQHVLYGFSQDDPPTMAPEQDSFMRARTPNADDLAGACFLYPSGSFHCSANADCPLVVGDGADGEYYVGQLTCDGQGRCGGVSNEVPEPTQALGQSCSGDGDCMNQMTCYPIAANASVCASECTTNPDNCPNGFACTPYSNQPSRGLCFAGEASGTTPDGSRCTGSNECMSGLCAPDSGGSVCREPCRHATDCGQGQTCQTIPGASGLGACVAGQTTPTQNANGSPCETSDECTSGLCAGSGFTYLCTQPCAGSGAGGCPNGYACVGFEGGGGGCFESANKAVGDACEDGSECASGLCFQSDTGTTTWCAGQCQTNADCPCRMQCESIQYLDDRNHTVTEKLCNPGIAIACLPAGTSCTSDSECAGGACFHGACEIACSAVLAGGGCPNGEGCARREPGGIDGICQAPGTKQEGEPCGQDNACATTFCNDFVCATSCNPFGANTCGVGRVCQGTATAQLGACAAAAPPADEGPEAPVEPAPDTASGSDESPATNPTVPNQTGGNHNAGCASATGPGAATGQAVVMGVSLAAVIGLRLRSRRRVPNAY